MKERKNTSLHLRKLHFINSLHIASGLNSTTQRRKNGKKWKVFRNITILDQSLRVYHLCFFYHNLLATLATAGTWSNSWYLVRQLVPGQTAGARSDSLYLVIQLFPGLQTQPIENAPDFLGKRLTLCPLPSEPVAEVCFPDNQSS